jgi:hypothetical protein
MSHEPAFRFPTFRNHLASIVHLSIQTINLSIRMSRCRCGNGRGSGCCISLRYQMLQHCVVGRRAVSRNAQARQTKAVTGQFVRPEQLSAGKVETMKMTAAIRKNMRIIARQRNEVAADKAAPDFRAPEMTAVRFGDGRYPAFQCEKYNFIGFHNNKNLRLQRNCRGLGGGKGSGRQRTLPGRSVR